MNNLEASVLDMYCDTPEYDDFINIVVSHLEKNGIDENSLIVKFEPTHSPTVFAQYKLSVIGYLSGTQEQFTITQCIDIK